MAAIASDFSPFEMNSLEKSELSQFITIEEPYIQVRNHILRIWHDNLTNYITIKECEKSIQVFFLLKKKNLIFNRKNIVV